MDDAAASGHNADGMTTAETICCDRPDSPLSIGLRFHQLGSRCHRASAGRAGGRQLALLYAEDRAYTKPSLAAER